MYTCYKVKFSELKIDAQSNTEGEEPTYLRLRYNGNSFFLSYLYLTPAISEFNSLRCFNDEDTVYLLTKKISPGNYLICWISNGDVIELRDTSVPMPNHTKLFLSILSTAALIASLFFMGNSDSFLSYFCYGSLIFFSAIISIVMPYNYFHEKENNATQLQRIKSLDLNKHPEIFSPLEVLPPPEGQARLNKYLPHELEFAEGIVEEISREIRNVENSTYVEATGVSISESYSKIMLNFFIDGRRCIFEYREDKTPTPLNCTAISPFIVNGDSVIIFWYEAPFAETPLDAEVTYNGKRVMCLYNRTSNTWFKSCQSIKPKLKGEVFRSGGRILYQSYGKF